MNLVIFLFFAGLLLANPVINSAHMAKIVYEDSPQTQFKLLYHHENKLFGNKLLAFYDAQTETIYLTIRGTDKLSNWISNTHIAENALDLVADYLISENYQKYYHGFKKGNQVWFVSAFKDLEKACLKILKKHPNTKFIFTGHSYGGLMANLVAQSIYHANPQINLECHSFNSPGAQEIRKNSLKLPHMPTDILENSFFNHVRITDIIGNTNTHEGNLLYYQPVLNAHAIDHFAEDLKNGMEPL